MTSHTHFITLVNMRFENKLRQNMSTTDVKASIGGLKIYKNCKRWCHFQSFYNSPYASFSCIPVLIDWRFCDRLIKRRVSVLNVAFVAFCVPTLKALSRKEDCLRISKYGTCSWGVLCGVVSSVHSHHERDADAQARSGFQVRNIFRLNRDLCLVRQRILLLHESFHERLISLHFIFNWNGHSQIGTITAGFLGSLLFVFLLTCIGNLERLLFGLHFQVTSWNFHNQDVCLKKWAFRLFISPIFRQHRQMDLPDFWV